MTTSSHKPHTFTFSNGLTLIVEEDHTLPIASVQAWCATGSVHEGAHVGAGVSHLLEHMLFKGTARRAPGAVAEEVRCHGGQMNAFTSFDKTVYLIDLPSSNVSDAVDILADVMMNAALPLEEYIKEQEVIRREFAMRDDNPALVSIEFLLSTAFQVSPVRESVGGQPSLFNKLTRDEVMAYYKKRYVPSNLCFVVVGDVDAKKIKEQLEALFQREPDLTLELLCVPEEPPQTEKRIARKTFLLKQSRLNLAWKAPCLTSPDAPAMDVLAGILGSGNSSLLKQEVREKKELVYQLNSAFRMFTQKETLCFINTLVDPEKRDDAEAEILHQIELFKTRGATEEEVERSKNLLLSDHWRSLTSVGRRALDYGNGWIIAEDPCFKEKYFKNITHVTPEEVNRVAKKYLIETGLTITSLDPKLDSKAIDEVSSVSKKNKNSCQCGCN